MQKRGAAALQAQAQARVIHSTGCSGQLSAAARNCGSAGRAPSRPLRAQRARTSGTRRAPTRDPTAAAGEAGRSCGDDNRNAHKTHTHTHGVAAQRGHRQHLSPVADCGVARLHTLGCDEWHLPWQPHISCCALGPVIKPRLSRVDHPLPSISQVPHIESPLPTQQTHTPPQMPFTPLTHRRARPRAATLHSARTPAPQPRAHLYSLHLLPQSQLAHTFDAPLYAALALHHLLLLSLNVGALEC